MVVYLINAQIVFKYKGCNILLIINVLSDNQL